ncbi:MAG: GNAT family N-acetyltransferase [Alphaproteobacteria bacterium]|nr:GNAT family N-acetyltransferase [Alphaproteobacteria bacterium]|tara:strand:+ start:102 stop:617 length:516 start_codon:yes stop_codon:yes gene_type:complete
MSTEIRTDRLILRPVQPEDAGTITDLVNDPRIYRMVARIPAHQNVGQTLAWITSHEKDRKANLKHPFAITQHGELIGVTSGQREQATLPFNIGYWLSPNKWGKGFMTEATDALIRWLKQQGEKAFVSGYLQDNPASGRVLEKLDFMKADRSRVFCMGRGEIVDHVDMARIG